MTFERILKRENGDRVMIKVRLLLYHGDSAQWFYDVYTCQKGKRTWKSAYDEESWEYRKLSMEERKLYGESEMLKHVTKQEIHDTKVMLIKSIPI